MPELYAQNRRNASDAKRGHTPDPSTLVAL
jgi:hypothetical protein